MHQNQCCEGVKKSRKGIARPVAHVLALAPLDFWVRAMRGHGLIEPRYWLRFAFIVFTSFVGTITTAHERVMLWMIWRLTFGRTGRYVHKPGVVVIVGYYRSGTTHLHNLMSCDERFVTPKWYQCLAGQGFWLGWSLIRFMLVPFLGNTRPQDSVGFGPSWPGEDDFALCTWGRCSSIPGRFVFPSRWKDWKRWHGLEELSEQELSRWRKLTSMFVWKITRKRRDQKKIVLLKTPSHTARVAELDRLFDGRVKFVHLVRDPHAVIDSNVRLAHSLSANLLENAPDVQTVRDRIVEEYAYTETKCCNELEQISEDRKVRIRYQDLRADAAGTLNRVYSSIGMELDSSASDSITAYLQGVGAYASAKESIDLGQVSEIEKEASTEMNARYGLDDPACERVPVEPVEMQRPRMLRSAIVGIIVMLACALGWIALAWGVTERLDLRMRMIPLVWIAGAIIGLSMRRASKSGSAKVGLMAAMMTLLVVIVVAFPIALIHYNFAANDGTQAWIYHNTKYGVQGISAIAPMVFIVLGMVTAYRHGSQSGARVPGAR